MELEAHLQRLSEELGRVAEAAGGEAAAVAERLVLGVESAARLMLLSALSDAAAEITSDLAPGSVEVRLRGMDPEFVVTPPPVEEPYEAAQADEPEPATSDDDGGSTARINLRLPEAMKAQLEQAAGRERLSINAWLVRAVDAALRSRSPAPGAMPGHKTGQHITGWVR